MIQPTGSTPAPRFSVITAAYNCAPTIEATVASVLAQSLDAWEMVVVDDGSTDDTVAVVRRAAQGDGRIHVISQSNAGRASARNAGVREARGEYLCILDGDDLYEPDYLASMQELADRYPDRDIYSCNGHYLYPNGARLPIWRGRRYRGEREFALGDVIRHNEILTMAVVRRVAFERVGGYRSLYVEDYDLWLRILASGGRHVFTPAFLALYRISPSSAATNREAIETSSLEAFEALGAEYPGIDRALVADALRMQRARVEIASMERRLARGDESGARGVFFRNARFLPTRARRIIGRAAMLVHPALYRRIFLQRQVQAESASRGSL